MPWIDTIDPVDAEGELAKIYSKIGSSRGGVANVHQLQSLNPKAMLAHLELYKRVMFGRSSLARVTRERMAVVVSYANRCHYCIEHHGEALVQAGDSAAMRGALGRGEIPASLPEVDRLLLQWAHKLTVRPYDSNESDVEKLREAGLEDAAILDASQVIAYYNYVNRLVLSLGGELEDDYAKTCLDDESIE